MSDVLCEGGGRLHRFVPGFGSDEKHPDPRWCNVCGEAVTAVVPTEPIELLTADEHRAVELLGQAAKLMIAACNGEQDDLAEVVSHIHVCQHMVMAQAAARAYPDLYRLLGPTQETS